ncbi:MAG: S24 family peptidase [Glycocaulis sp.]
MIRNICLDTGPRFFPIVHTMGHKETDPYGLKRRLKRLRISYESAAEMLSERTREPWNTKRVYRIVNGDHVNTPVVDLTELERLAEEEESRRGVPPPAPLPGHLGERHRHGFEAFPSAAQLRIPVYGLVAASPNGAIHLDHSAVVDTTARHPAQGERDDVFALEVWNESMSPRYEPGELVYCVRGRQPRRGQDCVIELKSGDAFLKIYEREHSGVIFTRQLNPDEEVRFQGTQLKAIHAVVGRG